MNDMIRNNIKNNDWINPAVDTCPNCSYNKGVDETVRRQAARDQMATRLNQGQTAMPNMDFPPNMAMPQNMPNPPSTSNYAATSQGYESPLGISAQGTAGVLPPNASMELPGLTAVDIYNQPTAVNLESLQYLNGFLLTQIGKKVMVEFLIGSNMIEEKTGTLVGVGANYILISEFPSGNVLACDFYSIKFITFYY